MAIPESTYDDVSRVAKLSSGQIIHGFHKSIHCKGSSCPVHTPSKHELRDKALVFNFGPFIFERIVERNDGTVYHVPDPDDYNLNRSGGNLVYRNSIRCNHCADEITSSYQHEFVSCSCGTVFVDGGSVNRRIGGTQNDYTDTAILLKNWKFKYLEGTRQ